MSRPAASLARRAKAVLEAAGIEAAAPDAEVLLAHVLGLRRARLHAHPDEPVPAEAERRYLALVARRASREPLQYLTGIQEFWSLALRVSPAVLIPRPETEGVVEAFLRVEPKPDPLVADVGTGSGCLAIAVAKERARALLHATDVSDEALAVARLNAAEHGVAARVAFHRGDLLEPLKGAGLQGRLDAILCNPPYIAEQQVRQLEPEVRDHEPRIALTPGPDPLAFHRRLAAEAPAWLRDGGHLIVELGDGQEDEARALYGAGRLQVIEVRPDLAGIPRVLIARRR